MQNETKQVQKPNGSTLELTKTFKNTRKDNKQGKIEMQQETRRHVARKHHLRRV